MGAMFSLLCIVFTKGLNLHQIDRCIAEDWEVEEVTILFHKRDLK